MLNPAEEQGQLLKTSLSFKDKSIVSDSRNRQWIFPHPLWESKKQSPSFYELDIKRIWVYRQTKEESAKRDMAHAASLLSADSKKCSVWLHLLAIWNQGTHPKSVINTDIHGSILCIGIPFKASPKAHATRHICSPLASKLKTSSVRYSVMGGEWMWERIRPLSLQIIFCSQQSLEIR